MMGRVGEVGGQDPTERAFLLVSRYYLCLSAIGSLLVPQLRLHRSAFIPKLSYTNTKPSLYSHLYTSAQFKPS
jgi:hypothetical protein